jgi:hypothetical protein
MKHTRGIIFLALLGLLVFSTVASEASLADTPLYADEAINGVTYNITNQNVTAIDDWSMYRHDLQGTGSSSGSFMRALQVLTGYVLPQS